MFIEKIKKIFSKKTISPKEPTSKVGFYHLYRYTDLILPSEYRLSLMVEGLKSYAYVKSFYDKYVKKMFVLDTQFDDNQFNLEKIEEEFRKRIKIETEEYKKLKRTAKFKKSVEKIKRSSLDWSAVVDINRYHEVMLWLKYHKEKSGHPVGKVGESLLHWAVLTNLGLTIELLEECGYDPNVKDKNGLTPLDWLLERFVFSVLMENNAMPPESKYKIYRMTEDIGLFLYEKGGRSSQYSEVDLLVKGGCRVFLSNIYRINGLKGLKTVPPYNSSALHSWVTLVESENRDLIFNDLLRYGLNINELDDLDQTPLYYCIDAFIVKPQHYKSHWKYVIVKLLENGADPYIKNKEGLTTLDLFDISNKQEREMLKEYKSLIKTYR